MEMKCIGILVRFSQSLLTDFFSHMTNSACLDFAKITIS